MIKPKKQLGQNFLKNPKIVEQIIEVSGIKPSDTIIEIGPGTGILTEKLVKTGAQVFAIEKDFSLIELLKKNLGTPKNLKIIHQDALWFNIEEFSSRLRSKNILFEPVENYKVIANIPFNITSPLIRKFLEDENKPEMMVLMIQKEVAERITAKPGNSGRGLLTLLTEFYAKSQICFEVSKKEFYPVPKVDSAVIKIEPYNKPHLRSAGKLVKPELFFKIVKAGFSSKRQQIHNSLAATMRLEKEAVLAVLKKAEISPTLRAENLTLEEWLKLYKSF